MPWLSLKRVGLVACAAFLCARHAEAAEEKPGSFRLAWVRTEGGEACIDQRELERRVRTRLGRDPFDAAAPQSIEGEIAFANGVGRATIRVRDDLGALLGRREIE